MNLEPFHKILKEERKLRIAHLIRENNSALTNEDISRRNKIISNLKKIISSINKYFQTLCLGVGWAETHRQYIDKAFYTSPSTNFKSDIEELLDLVAKNSYLLNLPEKEPDFWPYYKEHNLSSNDLIVLNSYRNKFGLPEV